MRCDLKSSILAVMYIHTYINPEQGEGMYEYGLDEWIHEDINKK